MCTCAKTCSRLPPPNSVVMSLPPPHPYGSLQGLACVVWVLTCVCWCVGYVSDRVGGLRTSTMSIFALLSLPFLYATGLNLQARHCHLDMSNHTPLDTHRCRCRCRCRSRGGEAWRVTPLKWSEGTCPRCGPTDALCGWCVGVGGSGVERAGGPRGGVLRAGALHQWAQDALGHRPPTGRPHCWARHRQT